MKTRSRRVYTYLRGSDKYKQEESPEKQKDVVAEVRRQTAEEIDGVLMDYAIELESATGVSWRDRPVLQSVFQALEPGDVLIVWRMDRIDRHPFRMIDAVNYLCNKQVGLISVQERGGMTIDLRKVQDRSFVMMMALVADWWGSFHSESVKEGVARAYRQGKAITSIPRLGQKHISPNGQRTLHCVFDPKDRRWRPERSEWKGHWRWDWCNTDCRTIAEIVMRHRVGESYAAIARDFYLHGRKRSCGIPWVRLCRAGRLNNARPMTLPADWERRYTKAKTLDRCQISKAYALGEKLLAETGKIGHIEFPLPEGSFTVPKTPLVEAEVIAKVKDKRRAESQAYANRETRIEKLAREETARIRALVEAPTLT